MSSFKKRVAILLVVAMTVLSCVPGYAEIPENQNGEVPGNEIELATPQEIASPSEEIEENEIVEPAEPEVLEEKALGEELLEEEEMLTSSEDDIETWAELQDAIDAATQGEIATISLTQNLTATASDSAITIKEGQNITLDLNGWVLNRGLISATGSVTHNTNGSVIYVASGSQLTIIDSKPDRAHKFSTCSDANDNVLWVWNEDIGTATVSGGIITGGTGKDSGDGSSGGGVYVDKIATYSMTGGTICGNSVTADGHGAGAYVNQYASFEMSGDSCISGNRGGHGAGIYFAKYTEFTMSGKSQITKNESSKDVVSFHGKKFTMSGESRIAYNKGTVGGVVLFDSALFEMKGGSIDHNEGTSTSGGLTVSGGATFRMEGGAISNNKGNSVGGLYNNNCTVIMTGGSITDNKVEKTGYGVMDNGSLTLGGSARITGNTVGSSENNLYLITGKTVSLATGSSAPTASMSVGVTVADTNRPVNITATSCELERCPFFADKDNEVVIHDNSKIFKLAKKAEIPTEKSYVYDGNLKVGVATGSWYELFGTATATEVGDYIATASLADVGYGWSDGTTEPKTFHWSITKASGSIATPPTPKTLTYNGSDQALVEVGEGATGTIEYKLGEDGEYSTSIPKAKNADTYTVYYKVNGDSIYGDVAEASVSVTIAPKEATLRWGTTTWTYDGQAHSTNCRVSNAERGDWCRVTIASNSITNVGTQQVEAASLSNPNYKLPANPTATLTVNKAPLRAIAESYTVTYGDPVPAYKVTYYDRNWRKVTEAPATPAQLTSVYTSTSSVGTYPIEFAQKPAFANYDVTTVDGTVTVNKAKVSEINITVTDPAKGKIPSGTATAAEATVDAGTAVWSPNHSYFRGSTRYTVNIPVSLTDSKNYEFESNWWDVTAKVNGHNATYRNGVVSYTFQALPARVLTDIEIVTAPKTSYTYGENVSLGGLVIKANYDDKTSENVAYNNYTRWNFNYEPEELTAATDVLTITYKGKTATQSIVVAKAPLTATAKSYTVTYGDSAPAYEVDYTGWKKGTEATLSDAVLSSEYASTSDVGTYDIIFTATPTFANYEVVTATGSVTVNKATLTATASSHTVKYGAATPSYSVTYGGWIHGEVEPTSAPVVTSAYTPASPVGAYDVTITTKPVFKNYEVTTATGSVTVEKAPLRATASSFTVAYGSEVPTYTVEYSGWTNGTESEATPAVLRSAYTTTSPVGEYGIEFEQEPTFDNYEVTTATGSVTVEPAVLTEVKAVNQTYTGRELIPVITAKAGDMDATFTVGSWSDALVDPGTYTATVSGTGNFTGEMQVTFTIDPRRSAPSGGGTKTTKPAGAVIGNWTYLPATDKWTFTSNEGRTYHNEWAYIFNPYAQAGQSNVSWFFFDANGIMLTGYQWLPSLAGGYRLWYLHPSVDGVRGRMYENELTPEGYTTDANGWVSIGGVVQAR